MRGPYIVKSLKQLIAISSPGRDEIIDAIDAIGPCKVAEIAQFLRRSRNAMYYHIRVLRDCGLIVETMYEAPGERPTAVYDLPGRPVIVPFDLSSERAKRATVALGRSRFAGATRSFAKACLQSRPVTDGPRRNLWVTRRIGWLSDAELEDVNRLLILLYQRLRPKSNVRAKGKKCYELTLALAPNQPRKPIPTDTYDSIG